MHWFLMMPQANIVVSYCVPAAVAMVIVLMTLSGGRSAAVGFILSVGIIMVVFLSTQV